MRRECKKRGIKKLKVVFSEEEPTRPLDDPMISCRLHCICPPGTQRKCTDRRDIPGSLAFVPSVMGLIIAGEVIRDLAADEKAGKARKQEEAGAAAERIPDDRKTAAEKSAETD